MDGGKGGGGGAVVKDRPFFIERSITRISQHFSR